MAAITFFSTNVAAAVFMLFPAIMFTMSAVAMLICILRVGASDVSLTWSICTSYRNNANRRLSSRCKPSLLLKVLQRSQLVSLRVSRGQIQIAQDSWGWMLSPFHVAMFLYVTRNKLPCPWGWSLMVKVKHLEVARSGDWVAGQEVVLGSLQK